MMHNWNGDWGVGNWLLMGFGMLVFWVLVVAGLVWLVRATPHRQAVPPPPSLREPAGAARQSAREILDERYARGEIGDDDYRTRRDTLASR